MCHTKTKHIFQIIITACVLHLAHASGFSKTIVYIIHGYGSNTLFMNTIASYLNENGYECKKWGYHSIIHPIPQSSKKLYQELKHYSGHDTVNFVTHSMGGLVVRGLYLYIKNDPEFVCIDKIVMITPPNKGAQIADFFSGIFILKWMMGPNILHMRTDSLSLANTLPNNLGPTVGIIAGAKFKSFLYDPSVQKRNDGYLSLDRAKLGTEKDFFIVSEGHLFILYNQEVKKNILHFLRNGRFIVSGS